jgi:hypothetical protein
MTTPTHISDVVPNVAPLTGAPACPKCGARMWDNRASKRNPKAPDFKCRDGRCDGVLWPGQHKTAMPIVKPRKAENGDQRSAASPQSSDKPTSHPLRSCYLDATDFVLAEVRPRYEHAGIPCSDATVAAIVATVFIQTCKTGRETL